MNQQPMALLRCVVIAVMAVVPGSASSQVGGLSGLIPKLALVDATTGATEGGTDGDDALLLRLREQFLKQHAVQKDARFFARRMPAQFIEKSNFRLGFELPDGLLHGPYAEYSHVGQLMVSGGYRNGKRDGTWTWLGVNGEKRQDGSYRNGKKQGAWWTLAPEGKVETLFDEGVERQVRGWHPDGRLRYVVQCDGRRNDNARRVSMINYEGIWTSWDREGRLETVGSFRDGKKSGLWTEYFPSGELQTTTVYENGGRKVIYWSEGRMHRLDTYVIDTHGGAYPKIVTFYGPEGTAAIRVNFDPSVSSMNAGHCVTYWPDGRRRAGAEFENGRI